MSDTGRCVGLRRCNPQNRTGAAEQKSVLTYITISFFFKEPRCGRPLQKDLGSEILALDNVFVIELDTLAATQNIDLLPVGKIPKAAAQADGLKYWVGAASAYSPGRAISPSI